MGNNIEINIGFNEEITLIRKKPLSDKIKNKLREKLKKTVVQSKIDLLDEIPLDKIKASTKEFEIGYNIAIEDLKDWKIKKLKELKKEIR